MKTGIKKFLFALGAIIILVLTLGALLLGTDNGRDYLLNLVMDLSATDHFSLELHNLHLGQNWTLEYLGIEDQKGPWLELKQTQLRPRWLPLLTGQIHLDFIGAQQITMHRLPESQPAEPSSAPGFFYLPPLRILNLQVQQLIFKEDVFGQHAELGIHGAVATDKKKVQGFLDIAHAQRQTDHLQLKGTLDIPDQELNLSLHGQELPGGLVSHILGLDQGFEVQIQGHGPLKTWPLDMDIQIPQLGTMTAQGTCNLKSQPHTSQVQGQITLDEQILKDLPLADAVISFEITGSKPQEGLQGQAQINNAAASLEAQALWHTKAQEFETLWTLEAGTLDSLLPSTIVPGAMTLKGRLHVLAGQAQLQTQLSASSWTLAQLPVQELQFQTNSSKILGHESWQTQWSIKANCPGLTQEFTHWQGQGNLSGGPSHLQVHDCQLATKALSLDLTGSWNSTLDVKTTLIAQNINIQDQLYSGQVTARVQGALDLQEPAFVGQCQIHGQDFQGLAPLWTQILGRELVLDTEVAITPQELKIKDLSLGPQLSLKAEAAIHIPQESLNSTFSVQLPAMATDLVHLDAGSTFWGKVQGQWSDFDLHLEGQGAPLQAGDIHLGPTTLELVMDQLPAQAQAQLTLESSINDIPLSLDVQGQVQDKHLLIPQTRLRFGQSSWDVQGQLLKESLIFEGQSKFSSADLQDLGRIFNQPWSGALDVAALFSEQQSTQKLELQAEGKNLHWSTFKAQNLKLEAQLNPFNPTQDLMAKVQLQSVGPPALVLEALELQAQAKNQQLILDLQGRDLQTQSSWTSQAVLDIDGQQIDLHKLEGSFLGQKLHLTKTMSLGLKPHLHWSALELNLGTATLWSTGSLDESQALLEAKIHGADTEPWTCFFPELPLAKINADLKILGTVQNPNLNLNLSVQNIQAQGWDLPTLPSITAQATAHLNAGNFKALGKIHGPAEQPLVEASFSCPLSINLLAPALPQPSTAIQGEFLAHTDLDLLPHLLRVDDQIMSGPVEAQLKLGGTLNAPTIAGHGQIHQGRYENFRSGTRLENIELQAKAQGQNLELLLTAEDGHEGQLQGQATANPKGLQAKMQWTAMRLVDLDLIQSTTQGQLKVDHDAQQTKVQGAITFDPTLVRIPKSLPADLVLLDMEEVNTPLKPQAEPSASTLRPINLDLALDFPARLMVSGRGLDSEWSGNLKVSNTHIDPRLVGQMNLLRGKFDFLDRTFTLTKGQILLDGQNPPNPYVDIQGQVQVMETLIMVHIHGPAQNFQIALSSLPVLPQDELLSLILFGRSLQQISPLQAVRLAQAAATLTGVGGDLDFFQTIKNTLGLQEIEINKDDQDNTNVGLGGYVGGKYYMRTQRSVSGQDKTKVEVQLTPKISVETEIGDDSRQGGGIKWKRDY